MANNPKKASLFNRQDGKCYYCGKKCKRNDFTVDHIIPKSKGGKDTWKNSVGACFLCNSLKGNLDVDVFLNVLLKEALESERPLSDLTPTEEETNLRSGEKRVD